MGGSIRYIYIKVQFFYVFFFLVVERGGGGVVVVVCQLIVRSVLHEVPDITNRCQGR